MVRKTKNRTFDTDTATIVKKITHSYYGDPAGYETTMYRTPNGHYFLYTYGGKKSPYRVEKITYFFPNRARKWLEEN